jgi:hypothetical protein
MRFRWQGTCLLLLAVNAGLVQVYAGGANAEFAAFKERWAMRNKAPVIQANLSQHALPHFHGTNASLRSHLFDEDDPRETCAAGADMDCPPGFVGPMCRSCAKDHVNKHGEQQDSCFFIVKSN